ncbi:ATP-binding protein [Phyllobacterium sp. YR531]|uniref:sensor histidine kinase n=1 Tax=Phyllobacterium sp. YR531 TaxID=1144343 RepID=UPI00026F63CA|nr:ATP-binding protein [Phyllobacterium sp. YR531]EJN03862.1 signal transduction histidine kinase [Phyllobacterium sp. YR531]
MKDKFRPRLRLVVLTLLLSVMLLPLAGLFFFRIYENQLVRETEAELIAQSAVIAAIYSQSLREAAVSPTEFGAIVSARNSRGVRYTPIEPRLDLATDPILPSRPDAVPASTNPRFMAIGADLSAILDETKSTTLAGIRLLDPKGVVIAGGGDVGMSFAEVEEVRSALGGDYSSVMRTRMLNEPAPSLYSISRGTRIRIFVALPVVLDNRVAGVVYIARTPNNIVKHLYSERGKAALAVVVIVGATLLIGLIFLRTISRPIYELMDRTARISAGERNAIRPLSHHGTREMAELSEAFLDMARKLQARSDAIQTFATHVSHELKSPLTAIQGAAELLRDSGNEMDEAQRLRFYDNIAADTQRLNQLVRRLIELARAESADLTTETTSLAQALQSVKAPVNLAIEISHGGELPFRMSGEHASIIFSNLAENSAQHGARRLVIDARSEDDAIIITLSDDGRGVSSGNRERIFDPFFTTRRENGGTGIGLGIVAALLKAHNGTIRLVDSATGARFEMILPKSA